MRGRAGRWARPRPAPAIGRAEKLEDARGRYVAFAKATFPRDLSLDGVRVVVDAGARRRLPRGPPRLPGAGGPGLRHRRQAQRHQHQPRRGGAAPRARARGGAPAGRPHRHRPRRRRRPRDRHRREGRGRGRRRGHGHVRAAHDARPRAAPEHRGGHGHEQPRPRARPGRPGRAARAHAGGRPLRGRGHARRRLQPRGRAVGAPRSSSTTPRPATASSAASRCWPS